MDKPKEPKPDPALEKELKQRNRELRAGIDARERNKRGGLMEFLTTSLQGRSGLINLSNVMGGK